MLISVRKHCLPDVILKEKYVYFKGIWQSFNFSGKAKHPKYLPEEDEEILSIQ